MKLSKSMMIGVAALSLVPVAAFADGDKSSWDSMASGERYAASGATTAERALSDEEIRDIIRRSGANDGNTEVRYLGGPQTAIETIMCCENVEEQIETRTEIEETVEYIDAVTRREITQPVQRTLIQPIERTTVVPVQRRIVRPVTETVTNDIRYETRTAPVQQKTIEIPATIETVTEDVTTINKDQVTEKVIPYVAERNIYQPKTITTIQPDVSQVLKGRTETITNKVRYESETLPGKEERAYAPDTVVNYIPQIKEVHEEENSKTYFDAVTHRDIHQPVHKKIIQPVEVRKMNPKHETITNPTRYETVRASLVVLNIRESCNCGH